MPVRIAVAHASTPGSGGGDAPASARAGPAAAGIAEAGGTPVVTSGMASVGGVTAAGMAATEVGAGLAAPRSPDPAEHAAASVTEAQASRSTMRCRADTQGM